jgi:hypothetical protein
MPRQFIRRLLPDAETVRNKRLLRWLGPVLRHPRLWHIERRGIALGFAIGIFIGLLIPLGQIPVSTVLAIVLRANVLIAVVATFVTNPFTFAPIYYLAYRIGAALIGNDNPYVTEESLEGEIESVGDWVGFWFEKVRTLGKPLVAGLIVLATSSAVVGYFSVMLLWRVHVILRLRSRRQRRAA